MNPGVDEKFTHPVAAEFEIRQFLMLSDLVCLETTAVFSFRNHSSPLVHPAVGIGSGREGILASATDMNQACYCCDGCGWI